MLQARQAAEAFANKAHESGARERAKGAALEQYLAALRKIVALKSSAQSIRQG